MSITYAIFEAEFRSTIRHNIESVKKRFVATMLIGLLGLIFSFACIRLMKFVIDNPELFPEGSNEGYGTILVIFFALFTLRSAGRTYRRIIKSKIMDMHLVQPIHARLIMNGMLWSIVVPNFILSVSLLVVFVIGNYVTNTNIILPTEFLILFFLFAILSPICGFLFSVVGSLHPFSRKLKFLLTLSPLLIILMFIANISHTAPSLSIGIVASSLLVMLIFCHNMDKIFVEALESHKVNSSSHKNPIRFLKFHWLRFALGDRASSICSKEVTSSIRERDVLSSALSTFSIAAILIFWWFKVGMPTEPVGDLPPKLYYPGMLAISLYMGALLQCTMLGSTMLGVEGKRLWIMKSNPVESLLIMKGKSAALLIMSIPGLLSIWIPICILAAFPIKVSLFFGQCIIILIFCNTGLGIWSGSAFANFDENDRGNPDILVQFMLMGTSALVSAIFLVLPATVMLYDHNLGLFAAFIFIVVAYGILVVGIRTGASAYRTIYIDSYG